MQYLWEHIVLEVSAVFNGTYCWEGRCSVNWDALFGKEVQCLLKHIVRNVSIVFIGTY